MAGAQRSQRGGPAVLVAQIGDEHHEPGLTGDLAKVDQRVCERRRLMRAVGGDSSLQGGADRRPPAPGGMRRQQLPAAGAERHQGDPSRAAHGQPRHDERDPLGDVGLQAVGRAEGHRRRDVEHDPGGEGPLRHVDAHVRLAGARRRRGVEVAHVVTRLIGTQLGQLRPRAHARCAPVARHHTGGSARDHQVERVDDLLRDRARALPRGRDRERRVAHAALRRLMCSEAGSGTASSTRSIRSSVVTFSDNAS